ncbi:MAG: Kdo hydroxylase family protein [Candidatus Binatia bacterium]
MAETERSNAVPPLLEIADPGELTRAATRAAALAGLEGGGVVLLSQSSFALTARERELILDTQVILPRQKERDSRIGRPTLIMYPEEGRIERTKIAPAPRREVEAMMLRFSAWAQTLVETLLPGYRPALQRDRVTYRPCERSIPQGLHVDTSYGRPSCGRAMLRVFSNINTANRPRVWQVGEHFEPFAGRFLPAARSTAERSSWLLRRLGITRGQRNAYDRLIADIRTLAKNDADYQERAPRRITEFPSGSTWLAITDLVVHGAMSGQHSLDQSFFLPATAMHDPSRSSLRILERLTGRTLV